MKKIGIFSGTFDPIHMGHVAFALEAKEELGLSEVIFLPELTPRLKHPTHIHHRLKMLDLSLNGQTGLTVKRLDTPRFNVNNTLPELRHHFADTQLVLLLGSDVVRTFKYRWPGLDELLRSMELAIGLRGEDTKEEMVEALKECAQAFGTHITYQVLASPHAALTSTRVRQGTHTIEDIHPDVATYIAAQGLYLTNPAD